jgi:hypothetical protein
MDLVGKFVVAGLLSPGIDSAIHMCVAAWETLPILM